ncbi:DUF3800 domain-containing protein [Sphingomonas endophytica]|uniref:DUF3800 domain-containing protein n=1 Tax=Sphingomonas endophytica TaxID=869719 RepID=A0A147HYB2_9SPHN|nr:DUF3800 domain-containing protein [Sphingomonas endophytica]KTT69935.1 hypothetical protein NS334_13675 [Sphingomonas endophytica]
MIDRRAGPVPCVHADRYFLDESGHGGDLASAKTLDFAGQPFFALACVGAADDTALTTELDRLRTQYACGDGELKSSKLGKKLGPVSHDLVAFLAERRWPFFVELVDKRFFVAIHIVNHVLCGPYGLDNVDMASRNVMAEFLSDGDSDAVLLAYITACEAPSVSAVATVIDLLWDWLEQSDDEIARTTQVLTMFARDRVREASAKTEDFLPIADETEAGKKVWMLPNLQCLTNIYARINLSRPTGLDSAKLIHDEQMQYAKVLVDAKALMEKLSNDAALPIVPFADYQLCGRADLFFTTEIKEPCLQAADILAGCAMRFARDSQARKGLRSAFDQMIDAANPYQATGVNLVMTTRLLKLLGVPHAPTGFADELFQWA